MFGSCFRTLAVILVSGCVFFKQCSSTLKPSPHLASLHWLLIESRIHINILFLYLTMRHSFFPRQLTTNIIGEHETKQRIINTNKHQPNRKNISAEQTNKINLSFRLHQSRTIIRAVSRASRAVADLENENNWTDLEDLIYRN